MSTYLVQYEKSEYFLSNYGYLLYAHLSTILKICELKPKSQNIENNIITGENFVKLPCNLSCHLS